MKKILFNSKSIALTVLKFVFDRKPAPGVLAMGLSHLFSTLVNKVGGLVYFPVKGGIGVRQWVKPRFPETVPQQLVNALFGFVSSFWSSLSQASQFTWNTMAADIIRINSLGQSYAPSGFQWFMELGLNLLNINETLKTDPPAPTAIDSFSDLGLTIDNSEVVDDDKMKIDFPEAIAADHKVILYATTGKSPGITFVKGDYKKIAVLESTDISPVSIGDAYIVVFGSIVFATMKGFVKVRQVLVASGQSSPDLSASDVAI